MSLPLPGWYDDGSGRNRYWNGSAWTEQFAPTTIAVQPTPIAIANPPGRVSGFVLGLIALFFAAVPLVALPVGIPGWVFSAKAVKQIPQGVAGRGLAVAGLVLSIVAVCGTALLMILAIPGAIAANFPSR